MKNLLTNRTIELANKIDSFRKNAAEDLLQKDNSFIHRNCPICYSNSGEEKEIFGYKCRKCDKCTLDYIIFVPDQKLLHDYYNDERIMKTNHEIWKRSRSGEFKKRFSVINKLNINGPVIELGSGPGQFVKYLNDNGLDSFGLDIDESSVIKAENINGVKVCCTNIEDDELKFPRSGLILMYEIIEHLINPKNIIEKVFSSLKNGGYLIITTPNAAGGSEILIHPETKGRFLTSALYPPYHINAFTVHSLYYLLLDIGFHISEISTPGRLDMEMLDLHTDMFKDINFGSDNNKHAIFEKFQSIIATTLGSGHLQIIAQKPL